MKRIFSVILFLLIIFSFMGCTETVGSINNLRDTVESTITSEVSTLSPTSTPIPEEPTGFEKYMKDNSLTLTAKDIQYDMANNLGKEFGLNGYAELDDYYNYGFDDSIEKDYFCMRVEPIDGKYSDSWYIYCHRESYDELFDELKNVDSVRVYITCLIHVTVYEEGQGNMAEARQIAW